MKPRSRRGGYVRVLAPIYERGKRLYGAGKIGTVVDIESMATVGGSEWFNVRGIFIVKVKLRCGTTVQINELALEEVAGPA